MILSACRAPGPALTARVAALAEHHDDVVVAIDDHDLATGVAGTVAPPSLPARWAAVRALIAPVANAWCTPLVATSTLPTPAERFVALRARLGDFTTLIVEAPAMLAAAKQAGVVAEIVPRVADNGAVPTTVPSMSRALVVVRAQPFHRGHLALVQRAAELASEVVVVVAAAEQAWTARDPFTAGERLAMVRAALRDVTAPTWVVALPSPSWAATALSQLAFVAPPVDVVVAHNPVLRAMATSLGLRVEGLSSPLRIDGGEVSASAIRARLATEGGGPWLSSVLPQGVVSVVSTSTLLARCASIMAAEPR